MSKLAKTEYTVVTDRDENELAEEVDHLLDDGWRPCGGVAMTSWADSDHVLYLLFAQALTRETWVNE